MLKKKKLEEAVVVGGGATGVSHDVDPAPTPDSHRKQDKRNSEPMPKPLGTGTETPVETNVQATMDNGAAVSSIATKGAVKEAAEVESDLFEAFGMEDLTEEFKDKVSTIYKAHLHEQTVAIRTELEEEYQEQLRSTTEELEEQYKTQINKYLTYAVEQWKEENKVAIEHALRTEITENFIKKLGALFVESNFNIPDESLDMVAEMTQKVADLEEKLNESVKEKVELSKLVQESVKNEVFNEITTGMVMTQVEKLKTLSESVAFENAESYKTKLQTIKEGFFRPVAPIESVGVLTEQTEVITETHELTGPMAAYVSALKKTKNSKVQ